MRKRKSGNLSRRQAGDGWGRWSRWHCSVTCGSGVAASTRLCISSAPCEGPSRQTKECNEMPCPLGAPQFLVDEANKQTQQRSKSYQVKKGEELSLNCMGSLWSHIQNVYLKAKVVWYHNEEVFHHDKGRTGVIDANQDLIIAKALPKDNGVWACQVRLDEKSQLFTSAHAIAVENNVPDIEIAEGEPFALQCNNGGLARFFNSRLSPQWYHNTDVIESPNSDSGNDHELGIRSSSVTSGGVWKCKVRQLDIDQPKEWVTNVVKVKVVPLKSSKDKPSKSSKRVLHPKSSGVSSGSSNSGKASGKLKASSGKSSSTVWVVLVAVTAVICVGVCFCLRRRKRSNRKGRDVEKGESRKRSKSRKKKKFKSPKRGSAKRKEEDKLQMPKKSSVMKLGKSKSPPKKKSPKRKRTRSSDRKKSHKKNDPKAKQDSEDKKKLQQKKDKKSVDKSSKKKAKKEAKRSSPKKR